MEMLAARHFCYSTDLWPYGAGRITRIHSRRSADCRCELVRRPEWPPRRFSGQHHTSSERQCVLLESSTAIRSSGVVKSPSERISSRLCGMGVVLIIFTSASCQTVVTFDDGAPIIMLMATRTRRHPQVFLTDIPNRNPVDRIFPCSLRSTLDVSGADRRCLNSGARCA